MQINNTPQISYQPNFKQVNLVKVPKYFFKEGSSSLVCEKFVQESLKNAVGEKPIGIIQKILLELGIKRNPDNKIYAMLEYPGYAPLMEMLEEKGFSFSWFKQNTKSNLSEPKYDDFYSFYVLTKEDKNNYYTNIVSQGDQIKEDLIEKVCSMIEKEEAVQEFKAAEMAASYLNEKFQEIIAGKEVNEFVWELDNYRELVKKLDV